LFSRNERGARDAALSEWSENNEFMRLWGGFWGAAPKNFFENCYLAIFLVLLSEFGFIGFK
jgi:hypothetical protein